MNYEYDFLVAGLIRNGSHLLLDLLKSGLSVYHVDVSDEDDPEVIKDDLVKRLRWLKKKGVYSTIMARPAYLNRVIRKV